MSYTISLFSVKTKQKEQQSAQPDFFEKEENLEKIHTGAAVSIGKPFVEISV